MGYLGNQTDKQKVEGCGRQASKGCATSPGLGQTPRHHFVGDHQLVGRLGCALAGNGQQESIHSNWKVALCCAPNHDQTLWNLDEFNVSNTDTLGVNLTTLSFGKTYRHFTMPGSISPSVRSLTYDIGYDMPITVGSLPPSLTSLTLPRMLNNFIEDGALPDSLTELTFGRPSHLFDDYKYYDPTDPIVNLLGSNLKSITDQMNTLLNQGTAPVTNSDQPPPSATQPEPVKEVVDPTPEPHGDDAPDFIDPSMISDIDQDDHAPGFMDPSMISDIDQDDDETQSPPQPAPDIGFTIPTPLVQDNTLLLHEKLNITLPLLLPHAFEATANSIPPNTNPSYFSKLAESFSLPSLPKSLTSLRLGHGLSKPLMPRIPSRVLDRTET
ncbi:hypothetical protein SAMD00019534_096290 [Acytostelium subglobosum LB1]|uniref:hypothetical protein n=1 Tax=Acytostelium subglobosum LB1 TaxID=1410327 RepID=UPI0006450703|nr:hypothetical protein SAMD00019534_096290 [Acytostelium subglobosum LB1]GAM26454.1 hypothetical protein SAMD00019534_096290 [Acytostelium subglobosum LB1]|eukprot:XP_012750550.1 hypothetical protein SAMD00019534_096290 [Acytostelium subglobosum LB1]